MANQLVRSRLFDDFFNDFAPGFFVKPLHGDPLPTAAQIRVDVKENNGNYTVEAEVPGVGKDDIHVSIDGSVVTVRAEIKQQDSQSSGERVPRSFQLPQDIDQSAAKARYDNGVLTLTLPKKQASGSQRLTIE